MAEEVVLFKSEEPKSLDDVAIFLRQLANRLDGNEVVLRRGEEEVRLAIPNRVVLELKAEEEGNKRSLEIEIEWTEGEAEGEMSLG